jgi:hypothetical protein
LRNRKSQNDRAERGELALFEHPFCHFRFRIFNVEIVAFRDFQRYNTLKLCRIPIP